MLRGTMGLRLRWALCLAMVCLVYVWHVQVKLSKIYAHPAWDSQVETGQFGSDAAFHYHYARFFATAPVATWGALRADRTVQYPDTLNAWAEFNVAMDLPAGVSYRLARALGVAVPPFHVWVVWYDSLVSSLAVFGVFSVAWAVWQRMTAGVAAAVFYATLYPSYGRTVTHLFLREDLALPLILWALFATVRAFQTTARRLRAETELFAADGEAGPRPPPGADIYWQVVAALVWLAALASWQPAQFVLSVGVGAALVGWLVLTLRPGVAGRVPPPLLSWFVGVLVLGGLLLPVLRARQFVFSPAMAVLYGLVAAEWLNGRPARRIGICLMAAGGVVGIGYLAGRALGDHGHLYALGWEKLRFLGVKPEDPARLPWDARCLWEGAFNTATAGEFWRSLLWCGPLGLATWLWHRGGRGDPARQWFGALALLLVPPAWLAVRFFTFLAPAAAVWAAGGLAGRRGVPPRAAWCAAIAAAAIWQVARLDATPLDRAPVEPAVYRPVVAWLNAHTATNSVLLASVSESPVFLAGTGRPIILHSGLENRTIRQRYQQFLGALYGTEEEFAAFARQLGATYFIYDAGCLVAAPDSWRYKANRLEELPANSAAVLFATQPDQLRSFAREFATERFTVFRLLPE